MPIVHHGLASLPASLRKAGEAEQELGMKPGRLSELSCAQACPHYRVDGGEPLFNMRELREWVAANLLQKFNPDTNLKLQIIDLGPPIPLKDRPEPLTHLKGLRRLPMINAGIYFLCLGGVIQYIGQSTNPYMRIRTHANGKSFDDVFFLPVPEDDLDRIESELIHAINPPLNGTLGNGEKCAPIARKNLRKDEIQTGVQI